MAGCRDPGWPFVALSVDDAGILTLQLIECCALVKGVM